MPFYVKVKDSNGSITSVKKTLQKYDGDLKIDYTSDMFSVSVIIPY